MTRRLLLLPALVLMLAACGGTADSATPTPTATADSATPTPTATDAPEATATPPSADGDETSVFDLAVGACFDTEQEDVVEVVEQIDCAAAHTYELYAVVDHPAGSDDEYPGTTELAAFAEQECIAAFEGFVGSDYATSDLFIYNLQPSESTWTLGDREVLCALYLPDGTLEGSMEGSDR